MLTVFAQERSALSQKLRLRGMVSLGGLSFGLYMLHLGFIIVATRAGVPIVQHPILVGAALLITSLFAAHITFKYFEEPARRRIRARGKKVVERLVVTR